MLLKVENHGPQDDGWWRSCLFMRKLLRFAGGDRRDVENKSRVEHGKRVECRTSSMARGTLEKCPL